MTDLHIYKGRAADLQGHIPDMLQVLPWKHLKEDTSVDILRKSYIKGTIVGTWPLQRRQLESFMKLVLAETDSGGQRINVFLKGDSAEQCQAVEQGDVMALSEFVVEKSPNKNTADHCCHILVDATRCCSHVWVVQTGQQGSKKPRLNITTPDGSTGDTVTGSKVRSYTYTQLSAVCANSTVNVYGVVKFLKPPQKTRGTDYSQLMSITDQSFSASHDKLKCLFFASDIDKLPAVRAVGEIVRLHRLKITTFNGELQGQSGPGFSCLVFDGTLGGPLEPRVSANTFTISKKDQDMVEKLRQWSLGNAVLRDTPTNTCQLADCAVGNYFNLVCQVVSKCAIDPGVQMLLRVWDGTRPQNPVYEVDTTDPSLRVIQGEEDLCRRAQDLTVDVSVFDDHYLMADRAQPGDFIKLCNLHAARHKKDDEGECYAIMPTIELNLHKGTSYGRCLTILKTDSQEARKLKDKLDQMLSDSVLDNLDVELLSQVNTLANQDAESQVSTNERAGPSGVSVSVRGSKQQTVGEAGGRKSSPSAKKKRRVESSSMEDVPSGQRMQSAPVDSESRCLLRTASVTTGHHHVQIVSLKDVMKHSVPYKFRVRARVLDYQPRTTCVYQFLRLYCETCHFVSPVPTPKKGNASLDSSIRGAAVTAEDSLLLSAEGPDKGSSSQLILNQAEEAHCRWESTMLKLPRGCVNVHKLVERAGKKVKDCAIYMENMTDADCLELKRMGYKVIIKKKASGRWTETAEACMTEGSIEYFRCPVCTMAASTSHTAQDRVPMLQYQYMLRFQLSDDSGWLTAQLWREQAETFFNDVPPKDVLKNPDTFLMIKDRLDNLCPEPSVSTRPQMECCIMSYSNSCGICYQIFDTVLCV